MVSVMASTAQPILREKAFNVKPEKWPAAEHHSALRTCNTQVSTGREGLGRLDFLVWITCKPPSTLTQAHSQKLCLPTFATGSESEVAMRPQSDAWRHR